MSILASPSDIAFLGATLGHQLDRAATSTVISHRVVLVDDRPSFHHGDIAALHSICGHLLDTGRVDEVRSIDWGRNVVASAMTRWFGDPATPTDAGGRARYQYLATVDSARRDRVLHLDSDMLVHGGLGTWADEAVERLDQHRAAVAVIPNAAIPQARRPIEWVLGRRVDRPDYPSGWTVSTDVTSRACLLDRTRLYRMLPLRLGDADEQWERSVTDALERGGAESHTELGVDLMVFHPHRHNATHRRWHRELIGLVERGRYPYRRRGHPWDITTEGRRFLPWLPAVIAQRLGDRRR